MMLVIMLQFQISLLNLCLLILIQLHNQNQKSSLGIGSSTASKIIDYRNKNGKFTKLEDIMNVSGIGEAKFSTIKDYICI